MSDSPSISRQFSLCTVMETIVHCGPISRASIAKQTGLSKQTISEIARQLEEDGWIRETGRTSGHVGRTAITYEIVPEAACIAAIDLGGRKLRAAIADLAGNVLAEVTEPTDLRGGRHVVEQIASLAHRTTEHTGIPFEKVRLAIVGVPGAPDRTTGRVLMAPNIPGLDEFDVSSALAELLGTDVVLENDVNLAVIGERWAGSANGIDDLAYIAIGTGIGAGVMVGGELVRGAGNAAGELGFLPFGSDPFEPESLKVGALERATATAGICARYQALTGRKADVPTIFAAASGGQVEAGRVLNETAHHLALTIAVLSAVTNPRRVVLGGSIGRRMELVERIRALLPLCVPLPVEIGVSSLGSRVTLVGGVAIGLSHLHAALFSGGVPGAQISLPPARVSIVAGSSVTLQSGPLA